MADGRGDRDPSKGRLTLLHERRHALLEVTRARERVLQFGLQIELSLEVRVEHPVERPLGVRVRARRAPASLRPASRPASSSSRSSGGRSSRGPSRASRRDALAEQGHLEGACLARRRRARTASSRRPASVRCSRRRARRRPDSAASTRSQANASEAPMPDRRAVHRDHGLLEAAHAGDDRVVDVVQLLAEIRQAVVGVGVEAALQVRARGEAAPGAGHEHRAHGRGCVDHHKVLELSPNSAVHAFSDSGRLSVMRPTPRPVHFPVSSQLGLLFDVRVRRPHARATPPRRGFDGGLGDRP